MKTLTPDEVRKLWKHLAPGILAALSRNGPPSGLLLRDVAAACLNGNALVLVGDVGYGVVFIERPVCNLIAYTGSLREIKTLAPQFLKWAQQYGCDTIRLTGDPAWMRVVPELTLRSVVMELKIDKILGSADGM